MTPKEQEKISYEQKKIEEIENDLAKKGVQLNVTELIKMANIRTIKAILIDKGIVSEFEYSMKYLEKDKDILEEIKEKSKIEIKKNNVKKLVIPGRKVV